jgi:hypothetical protein
METHVPQPVASSPLRRRFVMGCWRGNKTSRKLHIDSDAVVGYVDLFTREKIG